MPTSVSTDDEVALTPAEVFKPSASRSQSNAGGPHLPTYAALKNLLEPGIALVLLVPATPVILFLAALVKLTDRAAPFYSQERVGQHGQLYRIFKIRTMIPNCEHDTGPVWSMPGDPRVTRLGRFLRLTHLDELPQLRNILRGEMSLIGPRPERPELIRQLEIAVPGYRERLSVRPGLTGLAQVRLQADTSIEHVKRKLKYDRYYVRRISLGLDLRICFATFVYLIGVSKRAVRELFSHE
jgi:lipopolysaccharide/colanic/teichoic acid biosynthesis glycosyltransferase